MPFRGATRMYLAHDDLSETAEVLASLLWMAAGTYHRKLRYLAIALILLFTVGIYQERSYPEFMNLNFKG